MFTQINNDRSNNLSSNRLGLLLKAAKYMDKSISTPLKKRGLLTSYPPPAPTKQRSVQVAKVSYTTTGPPKKRFKIDTTTICKPLINTTDKHDLKLRLIIIKSTSLASVQWVALIVYGNVQMRLHWQLLHLVVRRIELSLFRSHLDMLILIWISHCSYSDLMVNGSILVA